MASARSPSSNPNTFHLMTCNFCFAGWRKSRNRRNGIYHSRGTHIIGNRISINSRKHLLDQQHTKQHNSADAFLHSYSLPSLLPRRLRSVRSSHHLSTAILSKNWKARPCRSCQQSHYGAHHPRLCFPHPSSLSEPNLENMRAIFRNCSTMDVVRIYL